MNRWRDLVFITVYGQAAFWLGVVAGARWGFLGTDWIR